MTKWPSVIVKRRSSFPSFVSDRGQRIFSFQAVRSPRGCPVWTERGNGHRTSSPTVDGGHPLEVPRLISTNRNWEPVKGRRGSPRPRATPGFFPDLPTVSGGNQCLWECNSTPVCWGCQEGSTTYCSPSN